MKRLPFIIILLFAFSFCKAQMHPPSKEDQQRHKDMLQKELKLNSEQQQKIEIAMKEFHMQAEKLHTENPPPPPPMDPKVKEAMDKLVQQRDAQIKQALTEEQFKKFLELEKRMRPPQKGMPQEQRPL